MKTIKPTYDSQSTSPVLANVIEAKEKTKTLVDLGHIRQIRRFTLQL